MNITNIIDVVSVLFILFLGVLGLKRGVIRQGISTIGLVFIVILSFMLKNPLAEFLSLNLPFIKFSGIFKGVTVLNILLYQLISFLIIVTVLSSILNIFIGLSKLIEGILKMTVILSLPSKILGFMLGIVEGFIVVYITLFFLNQPMFNIKEFEGSKLTSNILYNVPILNSFAKSTVNTFNDIYDLSKKYGDELNSSNEFNLEAVDIMLKNKIVEVSYIEKLEDKGKLSIVGIDNILYKYR